jgi:hypothetical protein
MTKLSYEKTNEELNASVKAEVKAFFEKAKADVRAKQEKPYLMYPRVKLCQVVQAMQDVKRAASKKPAPPLSNYEHTITKKIKEDKKIEGGRESCCIAWPTSAAIGATTSG